MAPNNLQGKYLYRRVQQSPPSLLYFDSLALPCSHSSPFFLSLFWSNLFGAEHRPLRATSLLSGLMARCSVPGQESVCGIWNRGTSRTAVLTWDLPSACTPAPCSSLPRVSASPSLKLTRGPFQPPNLFLATSCFTSEFIFAHSSHVLHAVQVLKRTNPITGKSYLFIGPLEQCWPASDWCSQVMCPGSCDSH